jgi:hypothetical protein
VQNYYVEENILITRITAGARTWTRRGNERARVTKGSRDPKHGKRKDCNCNVDITMIANTAQPY